MTGKQLAGKLHDKQYRDAYAGAHLDNSVAFQVAAMRRARGWDQKTLAEKAGTGQAAISRIEDPDYGRHSLSTLKKIASALDVALEVRFVSFSQLVESVEALSPEFYTPAPFAEDATPRPAKRGEKRRAKGA